MKICIIGAGAYGCYTANLITKKFPNVEITMFDVGDSTIKNEEEIGFLSFIKESAYTGLQKGRFFGFGGASAKWGGQLLFFSKNDFSEPGPFLQDIIALNEKYKKEILAKFGLENNYQEKIVSKFLFTKAGIWLSYFNRNLFKYFQIAKNKKITIIPNTRIVKIEVEGKEVVKIQYLQDHKLTEASFNFYFLTAGAFESNRILLNSKVTQSDEVKFSDHLSQKVFKIRNGTVIGNEDFAFKIKGASLITKRFIGEINNTSFFAHPIFNSDFKFFQSFKKILFKHEISFQDIKSILMDMPHVILFIWSFIVKRRLYVYKGEWYIQIDAENPINGSKMNLSDIKDQFGQAAIDIHFEVGENTDELFVNAKEIVRKHLSENNVEFEECDDDIHVEKYEDTYHPYGMMANFNSASDYFRRFDNMLVVNTGILPRAGGINSTAAVFPLIEEYVNSYIAMTNQPEN